MEQLIYYSVLLFFTLLAVLKLFLFFLHIPAAKTFARKQVRLLVEYYKETSTRLIDFEQTSVYHRMKDRLSWANISIFPFLKANTKPLEFSYISSIIQEFSVKTVFEFGTYIGFGTTHFAKNVIPGGEIFTLDFPPSRIPPEKKKSLNRYRDVNAMKSGQKKGIGSLFADNREYSNIVQLWGDSLTFDFSRWYGKIDLCFIDAFHSYENVQKDTENAFKMLTENGIIIWHDFDLIHYDVYRYLNRLARQYKLYYIPQTTLALFFNSELTGMK